MLGLMTIWGFGAFIFYKVAYGVMAHSGITVLASLLMAVALSLSLFIMMRFNAIEILRYQADPIPASGSRSTLHSLYIRLVKIFIVGSIAFALLSKLVVFGFSSDLNGYLGWRRNVLFSSGRLEESISFILIAIAPMFIHFIIIIFGIRAQHPARKK
ncbi:hypothetical protein EV681_4597 [Advenella incenata]|uniref:Uncharacterized protein n=1 Tax=Advenella incenata TaxID=267800 RepID=A0A4Q7V5I9_9BURK|nr:hypothetical protein [Advenella incenata]RZT91074.1 hypothetical protein EV681_4597 [Advenella incenata]